MIYVNRTITLLGLPIYDLGPPLEPHITGAKLVICPCIILHYGSTTSSDSKPLLHNWNVMAPWVQYNNRVKLYTVHSQSLKIPHFTECPYLNFHHVIVLQLTEIESSLTVGRLPASPV